MKQTKIFAGVLFRAELTAEELTALFAAIQAGMVGKAMTFFEVEPVVGAEVIQARKRGPVPMTHRFRSPEGELIEETVVGFSARSGLSESSARALIAGRLPAAQGWTYVGAGADLREVA